LHLDFDLERREIAMLHIESELAAPEAGRGQVCATASAVVRLRSDAFLL
jgi:hypothetical protein